MQPESTTATSPAGSSPGAAGNAAPARAERRWRPAWRKWLVLGVVLLVLRLALPIVAAPLLAARLSRALGTRVEIGDVSLQPLDAIVTLRDVTVHAPAAAAGPQPAEPPIVAERVRVDVQWLPLLHQSLRVRELALESARIDLDRHVDGDFSLAGVERVAPADELPSGWTFLLDGITLRDSHLRVRDLAAAGATLLEATVRRADIADIQRRATAFGRSTNLRVDAQVGGGHLRVDGRYEQRDDGLVLDAVARVSDVPLSHLRSYAAELGWTDLSGEVSGRLRWQREPRRRDLLSGRAVVRRAAVQVADLAQPALAVRRGVATISAIDLRLRRITVQSLDLHGATLALRPDVAAPIPLFTAALARAARPARRPGAPPAAAVPPWGWMVEKFDTVAGRLRVLAADGDIDLRAHAAGENLGPGAYWSPLRVDVSQGDVAAAFDGTVRFGGTPTIEGRLTAGGIECAALAGGAGLPWAGLVQSGRAALDLTVGVDPSTNEPSPFYARGAIALSDLWLAGEEPGGVTFAAASANLTLAGFSLPAVGRAAAAAGDRRTRITFSDAEVSSPALLLVRQANGRILRAVSPASDESSNDTADHTAELVFDSLRVSDARLTLVDLGPKPPVTWQLSRAAGAAQVASLPGFAFEHFDLRGSDRRFGEVQLVANRDAGATLFELSATALPLAAATPYLAMAGLPYRFAAGQASFTARGAFGPGGWSADAALALQQPELIDTDASLERAIGMPIPAATALLRDATGAVALQVALAAPRSGGPSQADQIAASVRDAISGSRQATAAGIAPTSVLFAPGQTTLSETALQELAPLARLLASRPDLVVELSADTSQADRRWLAEQSLRVSLEQRGGFGGVLRALGMQTDRDRIHAALSARARGAPGLLDPADDAALQRLLADAPPIDETQLAALREARLAQVVGLLADAYNVGGTRVVVQRGVPRGIGLPAVRAEVAALD